MEAILVPQSSLFQTGIRKEIPGFWSFDDVEFNGAFE
jgi:hypothetical protein